MATNINKVMELLLAGKLAEARQVVQEDIGQALIAKRKELQELEQENALLFGLVSLAENQNRGSEGESKQQTLPNIPAVEADAKPKTTAQGKRTLLRSERSEVIAKIATDVAVRRGGKVTTDDVIQELNAQGFQLEMTAPGTSIGNVLFKSKDWKRVDKGVFRYVGTHQ